MSKTYSRGFMNTIEKTVLDNIDPAFPPRIHQRENFKNYEKEGWGCLWAPRLGKTYDAINNFCYLVDKGLADCLLIIAPNHVHVNWTERQVPKLFWKKLRYSKFTWSSGRSGVHVYHELQRKISRADVPLVISFNMESLLVDRAYDLMVEVCKRRKVMLIVDESHHMSNPDALRTMRLIGEKKKRRGGVVEEVRPGLASMCPYRRILSGTSNFESPAQLWSQTEILKPAALGYGSYETFCAKFLVTELTTVYSSGNAKYQRGEPIRAPKVTGVKNQEELRKNIREYASVITRDMCPDLPPIWEDRVSVEISAEQKKAYDSIRETLMASVGGENLSVAARTNFDIKLQQISSGFMRADDGRISYFADNAKIDTMVQLVQEAEEPVIVWCWFKAEEEMVKIALALNGIPYKHFAGNKAQREDAYAAFVPGADPSGPKVLVSQHSRMSEGFDLGRAGHQIHVSYPHSLTKITQANERCTQTGGRGVKVQYLVGTKKDSHILDRHKEKMSISNSILSVKDYLATL